MTLRLPRWHVIRTHPQREHAVIALIKKRTDFLTYCPVFTRTIRHAHKVLDVLRPLFARYVFVELDSRQDDISPVLYCPGVADVLKEGREYAAISEPLMTRIRSIEAEEAGRILAGTSHGFELGQVREIAVGPFASFPCRIAELDDKAREAVLLAAIFGRENKITVPYAHLGALVSEAGPHSRRATR